MTHIANFIKRSRKLTYTVVLFFIMIVESFTSDGQNSLPSENKFAEEKKKFINIVQSIPGDSSVSFPLIRNFQSQLNFINNTLENNSTLNLIDKDKAKRTVVYFLQEVNKSIASNKISLYDLTNVVESYQKVLTALLQKESILTIMKPVEEKSCQLIAAAFTQYSEHTMLDDIATYKRLSSSPEFILQFLENKPGFRFADSLLLYAVVNDPMSIIYYLRKNNPLLQERIRNAGNSYIRQVASFSNEKNAKDLTVFAAQLSDASITEEEISTIRTEPAKYFQLLVNTMLVRNNTSSLLNIPLQKAIKEKSLSFYVNPINDLHNANDGVRFACVIGLGPEDLYFIITTGGEELYTSSYLGLYKRLMGAFKDQQVDSLLDITQWQYLPVFLRMAANYNVLEDFLHRLSPEKMQSVLRFFIGNIETDASTALEKAMDIADSFTALNGIPETREQIQQEIRTNLERCISSNHYLGMRLYGILNDMIKLAREKDGIKNLWLILGDYETLSIKALENSSGNISEMVLFYGDEDGVASFSNFLKNYTDKSKWQITKNENWVDIHSLVNNKLTIYANRPLDIEKQYDLAAQDSLFAYLKSNQIEPSILVHRGHSYHLEKTLKRLTSSVKLSVLGSCGGYNKSISISSVNPDMQVIGSKKTGSKAINDPILDMINETLSAGNDISWPGLWSKLGEKFKNDIAASAMFNEYFAPSHNLGLFVLKLYHANRRIL